MSEEAEDIKPKLNLNISYEGTRSFIPRLIVHDHVLILRRYNCESESKYEI
jgi:hypothetical protein